jgi:hypothetical protein
VTGLRQLADELAHLRLDVDYLTVLVEPNLTRVPSPGPASPAGSPPGSFAAGPAVEPRLHGAHLWQTLTRDQAAVAWATLIDWVDWLIERYSLDEAVPECWYRHGAIVEELDALRAAWAAAYLDARARPADAAFWHDLFDRALVRLRAWDRYGCIAGTHRDDGTPQTGPTNRVGREDYLRGDIEARAGAYSLHAVPSDNSAHE